MLLREVSTGTTPVRQAPEAFRELFIHSTKFSENKCSASPCGLTNQVGLCSLVLTDLPTSGLPTSLPLELPIVRSYKGEYEIWRLNNLLKL